VKPVRHVVWDWNGTLFDDFPMLLSAANAAFAALDGPEIDAARYRSEFTRPVRDFYGRVVGREISDDEWLVVDDVFHAHYDGLIGRAGLAGDADRALAIVHEAGCSQSLLSMWRHDRLEPHVRVLEIDHHFVHVDGLRGEAGGRKEPHLRSHLDRLADRGIDAADVLLVGDTTDDAHAAAAVGARCVLYAGGEMPPERLREPGVPVAATLVEALRLGGIPTP
jgi:phosphoglycolate phosphatase-like HAD superfamily hydrolase